MKGRPDLTDEGRKVVAADVHGDFKVRPQVVVYDPISKADDPGPVRFGMGSPELL